MSAAVARTNGLLDAIADAAGRLGVDVAGEISALREFLAGPPVVAVVGVPHRERDALAADLVGQPSPRTVREFEPKPQVAGLLWDVLVLVTPADRALSRAEEELVRAAAAARRPVLVVVSRVHVLGPDPAGVAELGRFRLRPVLGLLEIPWYLDDGRDEIRAALVADLSARLRTLRNHEPAAKLAVRAVLDRIIGRFDEARATRARLVALLATIEEQLPATLTQVREFARLNGMTVADRLRCTEDNLYQSAFAATDAALAWAGTDGIAPWADVERLVRDAWQRLLDETRRILPEHAEQLRAELTRTRDNLLSTMSGLEVEVVAPATEPPDWDTPATRAAIDRLDEVDLEPVLARFQREARRRLPEEDDPDHHDDRPEEEPEGFAEATMRRSMQAGRRLGEELDLRGIHPVRLRPHTDLRAVTHQRLTEAHQVLLEAATAGGAAAADRAADDLRELVRQAAEAVERRHAWHGAYGELLALRAKS